MRRHPLPRLLLVLLAGLVPLAAPHGATFAGEGPRLAARVAVKDDGFVRVSAEGLEMIGAPSAAHVTVTRRGRAVPVCRLASPEDVVFLAHDHRSDHSAWGVYELWVHDEPPIALLAPRTGEGIPTPTPLPARRTLDDDQVHGPLAAAREEVYTADAPTWFLAFIPPQRGIAIDLDPASPAPGEDQTLEVKAYATRIGLVALAASWGEHDLGTSQHPTAVGGATFVWEVPAEAVPPQGTALVLRDVSPPAPPPAPNDVSHGRGTLWIDEVTLVGRIVPKIDARLTAFDVAGDTTLVLEGDLTREVFLAVVAPGGEPLGEPDRLVISLGDVPPGTRLFASTSAQDVTPEPVSGPADPLATAGAARHVILAVPELVEPARVLAQHRTATGLLSAVVPVTEVYDAFGHGEPTPDAIRAFLVALMEREGTPLEYVLLAGDATHDRTDLTPCATIPTPMARTMYNGATPADRLYALPPDGASTGGPAIGRLPFRDARTLADYVRRVIAYETHPPADASRRLLRFVTNEGRFGVFIDRLLETMFRRVVTDNIPPAYDIEVTFASPKSPFLWPPPEFDDKVIDGFNEGCLFYTYVGHGFGRGFDSLRVGWSHFPVLHVDSVDRVACRGTPPAVFVIACTTATFDQTTYEGIGEALIARPSGPIAYWGATRICHPAANTLLGRSTARFLAEGKGPRRLGTILARARDDVLEPPEMDGMRGMIDMGIRMLAKGADPDRLALEGTWMYTLLGDPAVLVAAPADDVSVTAAFSSAHTLEVRIEAPLPDGTEVFVSVEVPRDRQAHPPEAVENPLDEASFETIRANHARANDLALVRSTERLDGGRAACTLELPEDLDERRLVVKAWGIADGNVHQGAVVIRVPPPPPDGPPR